MSIGKNSIARAASSAMAAKNTKNISKPAKTFLSEMESVYLEVKTADLMPCTATFKMDIPQKLIQSIQKYGILEPLIICRLKNGELRVAAGLRRLLAARQLQLQTVPARVFVVADEKEVLRIRRTLSECSQQPVKLQDVKFSAIVSLTDDMPDYLL